MEITHLQFADDVLFMRDWSTGNALNLLKLLKCFEEAFNLWINLNKSQPLGVGITDRRSPDVLCLCIVVQVTCLLPAWVYWLGAI